MRIEESGNPMPTISTSLSLSSPGEFDLEHCTKHIGLQPTTSKLKGSKRTPTSKFVLQHSIWVVKRDRVPSLNLDTELAALLSIVWPARRRVKSYAEEHGLDAGFSAVITITDQRPLYLISATTLSQLAEFELEFLMDVIDYSE